MSAEKFAEIMGNAPEPQRAEPVQAMAPQQVESMGIMESVQAIAPGLSLGKILGDIGHELKEQGAHGAHEAAAALFNGSAFVMYPHAGQEQEAQTQAAPEQVQPAQDFNKIVEAPTVAPITPAVETERDLGREM